MKIKNFACIKRDYFWPIVRHLLANFCIYQQLWLFDCSQVEDDAFDILFGLLLMH